MLFALERAVSSSGVDYTIAVSPSGMHRLTINSAPNGVIPESFISMLEFNSYRDTISEIVIDPSVTQIGKAAFRNMLNLSTVTVRADGGIAPALQVIGQEAFAGCSILRSINLEACTNLTTIEGDSVDKNYATSGAFTRSGLYSVTIPASVTNIGAGAFYGCPALQNVNFEPNVNDMTLGSHIFSNCVVLQNINLENLKGNITTVPSTDQTYGETGSAMLSHCTSLTSVIIPHGFCYDGTIQNICFGCTNLKSIAFEENTNITATNQILKFVNAESSGPILDVVDLRPLKSLDIIDSWSIRANTNLLLFPESITQIGSEIISDCNIFDIDFGENPQLALMGKGAFKKSSMSVIDLSKATALSGISADAFLDCSNLRKVYLPERTASGMDEVVIGNEAFMNCSALEQVYCNAGKVSVNSSATGVFSGINHEFDIVFGENTKTVTASLLKQLEGTQAKLKFNPGTIFSVEPSGDDSYSRMGLPFDDAGGDYFADVSGNIYKIISETPTEELELVYADKGNTGVCMIDERTTSIRSNAFNGCKYSSIEFVSADKITHIGEGAFANCRSLSKISNTSAATSITTPYTVEQVQGFFANAHLTEETIYNLFTNTSLRPDSESGNTGSDFGSYTKDTDNSLKLFKSDLSNVDLASFSIDKKELLTGENATLTINSGSPINGYTYRMYVRCSDGYNADKLSTFKFVPLEGADGIYYRDITESIGETGSQTVSLTIDNTKAPGKLQFWAAAIKKTDIEGNPYLLLYPVTDDEITGYAGATTTGEYFEVEWKVKPRDFNVSKSRDDSAAPSVAACKINGKTEKTIANLHYRIQSTKATDAGDDPGKNNYGSDYVLSIDFTDTITLPENVSFREDLFNALDTLTVKKPEQSQSISLMVKLDGTTRELATINNISGINISNIKVEAVSGNEKSLKISWTVGNNSINGGLAQTEITNLNFVLNFADGILVYTPTDSAENEKIEINNKVDARYSYSFSEPRDKSAEAVVNIDPGSAQLKLGKKLISAPMYFGEKAKYQITVYNPSAYDYSGNIVLTDTLKTNEQGLEICQYISPENIENMLKDDVFGKNLTVTITKATLVEALTTNNKVTSVDGSTPLTLDSSNTSEDRPRYNQCIDWTPEQIREMQSQMSDQMYAGTGLIENNSNKLTRDAIITITNNPNGSGLLMTVDLGSVQTSDVGAAEANSRLRGTPIEIPIPDGTSLRRALSSIEYGGKTYSYIVTHASLYTSEWTINDFKLAAGDEVVISLDADVKNTFQNLSSDWEQWYQFDKEYATLIIQNTSKLQMDGVSEPLTVVAPTTSTSGSGSDYTVRVSPDLILKKSSKVNGKNSDGVETVCVNNDIIDYTTTINHRGSGTYDVLPFVDNMFGPQALLIDPAKNSYLEGCGKREVEGKEYYILNPEIGKTLEYKNVWIDGRCADSVIVTKNEKGLINTIIKWYFSDTPAYDFAYTFNYKAVVVMDEEVDQAILGNFVWLNDNPEHRLYDKCFNIGVSVTHDKNIVTNIGNAADIGDDDFADNRLSAISRDNTEIIYRLDLGHKGSALSVTKDAIFDALPNISGAHRWTINDIDFMFISGASEVKIKNNGSEVPLNEWVDSAQFASISETVPENSDHNFAAGQQFIVWNENFSVDFSMTQENVYAYIYVKLKFPSDVDTYNAVFDQYGLQTLTNSFYLYNLPATVSHIFLEKGRVLLQKGVYEIGTNIKKESTAPYNLRFGMYVPGTNRTNISISNYNAHKGCPIQNLVTYYVTIKNCGKTKLYLPTIYDIMPKYMKYLTVLSSPDEIKTGLKKKSSTFLESGMPQFAHLDGTFVNAKITANNDGYDRNVVKLTVEPGEGEDGKLMRETDGTYKDMYYLQPDEYIQFGIMGYVTDDASAHKGAFTNDVIMEYVDFNGAGVEMVTKEEEPVIVSNKNGLMPNDGDRRIIDDEVVNSIGNYMPNYTGNHKKKPDDLWLSSSVDVVRGSVVPGINKTVSGDKTIYKATDSVDWKIQAINSGESWLSDYTISDTIEYPYTFNGKVCYSVFAPKPLREGEQSHRNRTWQPNEYIAACKASDSEYYLFDIRPSSEPNQFIILPANGSGLTQTITVNDKPKGLTIQAVQFGIDPLGADSSIFVSVTKDESTGSLTLNIRFGDKMWALLPGGGYGVLTVTTTNSINSLLTILDTNVKKTNFINSAIIYPSDEQNGLADYNRVTIGQKVAKSEDLYVGVQSNAAISAYESFPTTSVMEINETDKPENRGISTDLSGNTIFVDSTAKNVTYTMTVASYSGLVMEGLVVINSLPDKGDTLMFSGQARKSDFKISFLNDTAPEVYVNDAPYAGSYIIEYSDCTGKGDNNDNKFTAEDWQNTPNDTRWYSACKDTSRSVRVRFTGDLPENAEVKITYNAKIEADAGIENGKIAWNSFGYQYHPDISAMTGDDKPQQTDDRISAAPMVVGVSTPNELTLEKVIGNSVAFGNIDFNFVIYEGEAIDHQEFTEKAIGSALSGKNFTCATVTVQKEAKTGKTVLNEIGKNIFKYTYDPTTEKMVASTNPWTWVPGKKYTIVEIDPDGGADFEQFTNNGDNRRTYTFDYAPETEVTIIARNLYKTGELETYVSVKKVWDDDNNRDNIRPTSVTVKLLANGADTGKTAILNDANSWSHTFVGLPVRDKDLNVIGYTVEEVNVPNGYDASVQFQDNVFIITNRHAPEKTEVSGSKTWSDFGDPNSKIPEFITINLFADGKKLIVRK